RKPVDTGRVVSNIHQRAVLCITFMEVFCGAFCSKAARVTVSYRMGVVSVAWQYVVKQVIRRFLMPQWNFSTQIAARGCRYRNARWSESPEWLVSVRPRLTGGGPVKLRSLLIVS